MDLHIIRTHVQTCLRFFVFKLVLWHNVLLHDFGNMVIVFYIYSFYVTMTHYNREEIYYIIHALNNLHSFFFTLLWLMKIMIVTSFFYYEVHKVMCDMCDFMFDVVIISYVIMTWEIEWWWYSKPTADSALLYLLCNGVSSSMLNLPHFHVHSTFSSFFSSFFCLII